MWLPPFTALTTTTENPCEPDQWVCDQTYGWWSNESVSRLADKVIGAPTTMLVILAIGFTVRFILHRLIDRLVRKAEKGVLPDRVGRVSLGHSKERDTAPPRDPVTATRRVQRARTMGDLLKSIITGVVVAIVITMILAELNYDIGPIIASAGIVGVALGFGAQNLVKDFLAGIFMIFEDQLGVGDSVDLGEASGMVEAVSLRVTRLRDVNGTVWYVRNGEILRVGNQSQNWARTVRSTCRSPTAEERRRRCVACCRTSPRTSGTTRKSDAIIEQPEIWGIEARLGRRGSPCA